MVSKISYLCRALRLVQIGLMLGVAGALPPLAVPLPLDLVPPLDFVGLGLVGAAFFLLNFRSVVAGRARVIREPTNLIIGAPIFAEPPMIRNNAALWFTNLQSSGEYSCPENGGGDRWAMRTGVSSRCFLDYNRHSRSHWQHFYRSFKI